MLVIGSVHVGLECAARGVCGSNSYLVRRGGSIWWFNYYILHRSS